MRESAAQSPMQATRTIITITTTTTMAMDTEI
jgi:hypothetical protein